MSEPDEGRPDPKAKDREIREMIARERPGVRIRPPILFAAGIVFGIGLDRIAWPGLGFAGPELPRLVVAFSMLAGGLALFGAAVLRLLNHGTPVPSSLPALVLVTDGPYAFVRNPIYVGMALVHIGIALLIPSLGAIVLLVPNLLAIHYLVVLKEEEHLERRFGGAYEAYKARVRRWPVG